MCNVGMIILLEMDLWMGMQIFNTSNVESMYMTNDTTQILLSYTSKDKKNYCPITKWMDETSSRYFWALRWMISNLFESGK